MKKILVLGGTRFFGKRLVERLVERQEDVTIVTRGNAPDPFGGAVKRLRADRTDPDALRAAIGSSSYDVVYDNICYTPQEAEEAARLFDGRVGKYIVTSSLSVYPFGEVRLTEADFDPYRYPLPEPYPEKADYAEGKRLVEAVLFQKAAFPAAAVRFPIVLGPDDYTRRLHFHVEHVLRGQPIGVPNEGAVMSFISSEEAASFLDWLGGSGLEGPVNACSGGEASPGRVIAMIEEAAGKRARVLRETEDADMSPFGVPAPWHMDTAKAEAAGYSFRPLGEWLPPLIREIVAETES
ncbi:NAD-dependent epimerase/dehydratase family protein [Paenibacillus arenilitoris]|uniref:NAD-dependent epimerase/dehydratase family protein n=1 Tax=Paenibacillus arenilitoris TaxID=2772299 RepID=A0A927H7K4_9BACL|nr:NAD-dependent epimerase/dehydratase family protein [Paenibacillus arenilitoris]MBD2870632.1 NAD-dependent epimerase/dehydratase family protein [Paenibacillus arenilitoris]